MTLDSKNAEEATDWCRTPQGSASAPHGLRKVLVVFPMVSYVANQSQVRHQEHSGRTPVVASNDGAEAVLQHRIPIFTADLTIETTVAPSFPAKLKHQQKKDETQLHHSFFRSWPAVSQHCSLILDLKSRWVFVPGSPHVWPPWQVTSHTTVLTGFFSGSNLLMYRRKKWCSQLASLYLWLKNTESIEAKYLLEDAKCRGQSLQVSYLKVSLFWYFNPVEALSNGIFCHLYRMKYTEWMKPPGKCLVKWVVECKLDYHHKISQKTYNQDVLPSPTIAE